MRKIFFSIIFLALASALPVAGRKASDSMKLVDSGSFGIFHGSQRIATETFRIEQNAIHSVTSSEVKSSDAGNSTQQSELELASNGDLIKYTWRQIKPEHQQYVLVPEEQTLVQHYDTGDGKKTSDLPYLLPSSTSVLDDYFFIQRELLTWKYIATQCADLSKCKLAAAAMGVVVPHDHNSEAVQLSYKGQQTLTVKGAPVELRHFILTEDHIDWSLYFNDAQQLVMLAIPTDDLQVVRD